MNIRVCAICDREIDLDAPDIIVDSYFEPRMVVRIGRFGTAHALYSEAVSATILSERENPPEIIWEVRPVTPKPEPLLIGEETEEVPVTTQVTVDDLLNEPPEPDDSWPAEIDAEVEFISPNGRGQLKITDPQYRRPGLSRLIFFFEDIVTEGGDRLHAGRKVRCEPGEPDDGYVLPHARNVQIYAEEKQ
jgi:hypothetical protein